MACDLRIVDAARDQFKNVALALGKFGKCRSCRRLALTVNEAGDLREELFPGRLVLQQDMIAALQRNEFRAGN